MSPECDAQKPQDASEPMGSSLSSKDSANHAASPNMRRGLNWMWVDNPDVNWMRFPSGTTFFETVGEPGIESDMHITALFWLEYLSDLFTSVKVTDNLETQSESSSELGYDMPSLVVASNVPWLPNIIVQPQQRRSWSAGEPLPKRWHNKPGSKLKLFNPSFLFMSTCPQGQKVFGAWGCIWSTSDWPSCCIQVFGTSS